MTVNTPRIVHIDDDKFTLAHTEEIIRKSNQFHYLAGFEDPDQALLYIRTVVPEIVVLDINFPNHNGIEIALSLKDLPISIVFLTGYREFALEAYRANPLTFIAKTATLEQIANIFKLWLTRHPFETLERTISKIEKAYSQSPNRNSAKIPLRKLFIPTINSIQIIDLDKLLLIEAKSNYSSFSLSTGKSITSSRNLKIYADILENHPSFARIHRSYIVNTEFIQEIKRTQKGKTLLLLENGREINVSSQLKDTLINKLKS